MERNNSAGDYPRHTKHNCLNKKLNFSWDKFSIVPSHIIFEKYREGFHYKKKVQIINQDSSLHQVNIKFNPPYPCDVSINSFGDQRIIPGLNVVIEIFFSPVMGYTRNKVDRRLEVLISSPSANFNATIPILIPSCMPKLNFPTEICINQAVVGIPAFSTFWVCNMTDTAHSFSISAEMSNDFSSVKIAPDPKSVLLKPGDNKTFIIELSPKAAGCIVCQMIVKFINGKFLSIPVQCYSIQYDIQIDQCHISFPNTYLGLSHKVEFNLINTGDSVVKFEWLKYQFDEELEAREKMQTAYSNYLQAEEMGTNKLEYYELIGDQNANSIVLAKEFTRCKQMNSSEFLFVDPNFELVPGKGEIYPKSQIMVTAFFRPLKLLPAQQITPYKFESKAFLGVSSNPDCRSCLTLDGVAFGPEIMIPTKEVHFGQLFQSDSYNVKIPCSNKGIIDGDVYYESKDTEFESVIHVVPNHLRLRPNESNFFTVLFKTFKVGKFLETIYFRVENGESLAILISGNCKPLEMISNPKRLTYSLVPMCIPQKKVLQLYNPFNKAVEIALSIERVGCEEPLQFDEFQRTNNIVDRLSNDGITLDASVSYVSSECSTAFEQEICDVEEDFEEHEPEGELALVPFHNVKCVPSAVQYQIDYVLEITDGVIECLDTIFDRVQNSIELSEFLLELLNGLIADTKTESEKIALSSVETILFQLHELILLKRDVLQYYDWLLNRVDIRNEAIAIVAKTIKEDLLTVITKQFYYQKDWNISQNPIEYVIDPESFIIPPHCKAAIDITLTPNCRGKYSNKLQINANFFSSSEKKREATFDSSSVSIPMSYECDVPKLKIIENDEISIVSFVGMANLIKITVQNIHLVDGFCNLEEIRSEEMEIISKYSKFFIKSGEFLEVPLVITPLIVGILEHTGKFWSLGKSNLFFNFKVVINSLPPNLLIEPSAIITQIDALATETYKIYLENSCPCDVPFTVMTKIEDVQLNVEPLGGILGPFQKLVILVKVYACCSKIYKNGINIEFKYIDPVLVPIKLTIIGEPIVYNPPISMGECDLGAIFITNQITTKRLYIKNLGIQALSLVISIKRIKPQPGQDKIPNKFSLIQNRFDIAPTEEQFAEIVLQPIQKPVLIREDFYIEKIVGKFKILIILFTVKLRVIIPSIQWSLPSVLFELFYGDPKPDSSQQLTLRNNCCLPLDITLYVSNPYLLIDLEEALILEQLRFYLETNEMQEIYVDFDAALIASFNEYVEYPSKIRAKFGSFNLASVNLMTKLYYPEIRINTTDLFFLSSDWINYRAFQITNTGRLDAEYAINVTDTNFVAKQLEDEFQENLFEFIEKILDIRDEREIAKPIIDEFAIDENLIEESDMSDVPVEVAEISTGKGKARKRKSTPKTVENKKSKKNSMVKPIVVPVESEDIIQFVPPEDINRWFNKIFRPLAEKVQEIQPQKEPQILALDHYKGNIYPTESRVIKVKSQVEDHDRLDSMIISATIEINVTGGNFNKVLLDGLFCRMNAKVSADYINKGIIPWYQVSKSIITVTNLMEIPLTVTSTKGMRYTESPANGIIEITPPQAIVLENKLENCKIGITTITGLLLGKSAQQIGLYFNNEPPINVNIYSVPKIPTATILTVPRTGLPKIDWQYDYHVVQLYYGFCNDDLVMNEYRSGWMTLNYDDSYAAQKIEEPNYSNEFEYDEDFPDYYFVNGTSNLPNPIAMTSYLDQDIFIRCYNNSAPIQEEFNRIYMKYVPKKPTNSGFRKVQPLPFTVPEYEMSMGNIPLNTEFYVVLPIYFHGPGPLMFALRTEIPIPEISFEFIQPNPAANFTVNKYQLDVKSRFYKNRFQREETVSSSTNSRLLLKHCHSYDFNSQRIHTRKTSLTPNAWQIIKDYYSEYNLESKDTREPNTCSEIFQEKPFNSDGMIIDLKIVFKPTARHFWNGMAFDEIINLDIHLGPIIPILLNGNITS